MFEYVHRVPCLRPVSSCQEDSVNGSSTGRTEESAQGTELLPMLSNLAGVAGIGCLCCGISQAIKLRLKAGSCSKCFALCDCTPSELTCQNCPLCKLCKVLIDIILLLSTKRRRLWVLALYMIGVIQQLYKNVAMLANHTYSKCVSNALAKTVHIILLHQTTPLNSNQCFLSQASD